MKRRSIDPKTLRKSSESRRRRNPSQKVAGEKIATRTGYFIEGTRCKDYETYYEFFASGQGSDKVMHPKKTRTYRVLEGAGTLVQTSGEGNTARTDLVAGDEVTVQPGVTYSILTNSTQQIEFFVTQSAKYAARLQLVEEGYGAADLSEFDLVSLSRDDIIEKIRLPKRRGFSKAAEQLAQLNEEQGKSKISTTTGNGVNAAPITEFDWETAG